MFFHPCSMPNFRWERENCAVGKEKRSKIGRRENGGISEQPSCDWRNIKKKKIRIGKCEKVKQIWKMEGKGGYENEHSQKEGVRFRSGTPSSRARGRWSLWYDVMCVLVKWEGKLNLHFMLLIPWLLAVNTLSYNRKRYRFSVLGFHHCQRIIIIMDPCFFYYPPLFMFIS